MAGASLCLLCGRGVGDGTGTSDECAGLQNIAISQWTLSSLVLDYVFAGDSSIPAGITLWDVSVVPSMKHMFEDATWFNLDISDWDVSNVLNMDNMFDGASNFRVPQNRYLLLTSWFFISILKLLEVLGLCYQGILFNRLFIYNR